MNQGIGKQRTREDHKDVASQMYALYAEGRDLRDLVAVVGEEALSERDRRVLKFAEAFEDEFTRQDYNEDRTIENTLNTAWKLMSILEKEELTKIGRDLIEKYYPTPEDKWKPKEEGKELAYRGVTGDIAMKDVDE